MTMWIPGKGDHNTRKDNLFTDLYQECKLAPPAARLSYAIRVRLERYHQHQRFETQFYGINNEYFSGFFCQRGEKLLAG